MNECPYCGMHLNCNSNDVWICTRCDEMWIRVKYLPIPTSEVKRFFKRFFKKG